MDCKLMIELAKGKKLTEEEIFMRKHQNHWFELEDFERFSNFKCVKNWVMGWCDEEDTYVSYFELKDGLIIKMYLLKEYPTIW